MDHSLQQQSGGGDPDHLWVASRSTPEEGAGPETLLGPIAILGSFSKQSQETLMTLNFLKVIRNSSLKLLFLIFKNNIGTIAP